jgi:hypothetical protein
MLYEKPRRGGEPDLQALISCSPACAIDRLVHHATILDLSGTSLRAETAKRRADRPEKP